MKVHKAWLRLAAASAIWFGQDNAHAQEVQVDLQPCIIAQGAIVKDVFPVSEAYLFHELIKGFWGASQHIIIDTGDGLLDLNVDDDHGKCSAIFVGASPSDAQYEQLTAYSAKFKVRIVYFFNSGTADMVNIMLDKLGLQAWGLPPLTTASYVKLTDEASARVVNPDLQTSPEASSIRGMRVYRPPIGGTRTIVADLGDEDGNTVISTASLEYAIEGSGAVPGSSVAAVVYAGDSGSEEMHVFFAMAWFDMESWAWGHYLFEWATQGVFQGERRFWLGTMVDDHFLGTNVFEYDPSSEYHVGDEVRISGENLKDFLDRTEALNMEYNSEVVTEFAFNGFGILEKAESQYQFSFEDADAALLYKGLPPQENDDGTVGLPPTKTPVDWFNQDTIDGMEAEFESWKEKDDLLAATLDMKEDFFWQSHTLSHQARDNLGEADCESEDGGNSWIAVITGLFDAKTEDGRKMYAGRSMTTPGITGLFNKNCLKSAMDNKITCAPGDNTWDNSSPTVNVTLISDVSQFHSIYTTEETNGLAGFQIVPRFATYVYYNCRTAECLVLENLYIRRVTCGCPDVNPGTMDNLNLNTDGCDLVEACPLGLQALGTVDNVFEVEATTTTRWIMNGRRDKYMFHQANVVPTDIPLSDGTVVEDTTLLEYWHQVVLAKMARYLNLKGTEPFPARSVIFDDLCTNFKHHEELDESHALVTVTKTADGHITGASLDITSETVSVIPITVPTSSVDKVSLNGLAVYDNEIYGSDTTFYVASSMGDKPEDLPELTEADLPPVPQASTPAPVPTPTPDPTPAPQEETQYYCVWWKRWWCWLVN